MPTSTIEISVKGRWIRVPSINVNGSAIIVTGHGLKMAEIHDEEWLEKELEDPEGCVNRLRAERSKQLQADIFTFTQRLPATVPQYSYHVEWDSVAAVRLVSFEDWWEKLPQETRKNVRRSQKRGVVVKLRAFDEGLVREIVEVNNDSQFRQGQAFAHYGKTFDQVKKDYSSFLDRSDLICAYLGDELIGFLKLVYCGTVASVLQLLSKSAHYDKRPSNALVATAVELCERRGIEYLTYGKFNYGNKRGDSLAQYKARNGFNEVFVPRYYIPLTRWGAVCIGLKLHRGLLGVLPSWAISAGLAVRAKMFDLEQAMSRCSSTAEQPIRNRLMERSIPPAGSKREAPGGGL